MIVYSGPGGGGTVISSGFHVCLVVVGWVDSLEVRGFSGRVTREEGFLIRFGVGVGLKIGKVFVVVFKNL